MPTVLKKKVDPVVFWQETPARKVLSLALAKLLRKLGLIGDVAPSDEAMVKLVDGFCSPPRFGPRETMLSDDQGKIVTVSSGPREDLDGEIPF